MVLELCIKFLAQEKLNMVKLSFLILLLLSSSPLPPTLSSSMLSLHEQSDHFHRLDPLRGFKYYNGSYDITSRHYWGSVAFTGVHGFAMAIAWTLGGLVLLGSLPAWKKHAMISSIVDAESSRSCWHLMPLLAILLFTLLTLVASSIAIVATHNFHKRARKLEKTLLGAAAASCHAIRRVLNAVKEIKFLLCYYDDSICDLLSSASFLLREELIAIRGAMHEDGALANAVIRLTYGATLSIVCLIVVLVIANIVSTTMHSRLGLITIIIICWLLTSVCWILSGFHFFLHTYIEDSCLVLDEYKRNTTSIHTLSSMLPCFQNTMTDSIMPRIGFNIHNVITELNSVMTNSTKTIGSKDKHESTHFHMICDPFSDAPNYSYDPTICSNNSIPLHDLPTVLENNKHLLPLGLHAMIPSYTHSIKSILEAIPDIERLANCTFLKDAFDDVLLYHCKPLKESIFLLWSTTVSLSVTMMALEVAWVAKAFQDRRRQLLCGNHTMTNFR